MPIKSTIAVAALVTTLGVAHAETSCEALLTKISKGFQAAHQMSPANRTAKCQAYAMVTSDAMDIAAKCRASGDMAAINSRYLPVAKALGSDEEAYCGSH
jgi:hypothetical protein